MSDLEQRTLGLDTRLSVTFSPTMTLELYMQPFFAAGRYSNFEEYVAPRSTQLVRRTAGIAGRSPRRATRREDRVVRDRSGRRWPGAGVLDREPGLQRSSRCAATRCFDGNIGRDRCCTSHGRSLAPAIAGVRRLWTSTRDRSALLAARPDNIFLVKASWWLPLR